MADSSSTMTGSTGGALSIAHDSGAPEGSTDYTTVVVVHGWSWHAGNFRRLLPFAQKYNARVVLVNRRDYPGSDPHTPDQLATITRGASSEPSPEVAAEVRVFMHDRARELYDFLADFVQRERIPPAQGRTGGIVIVGWSFGTVWMTALLANVRHFPEGEVQLSKYVRRIVLYEIPATFYGYKLPPNTYKPLKDTSLSDEERMKSFIVPITAYYAHGDVWADGHDALEFRNYLAEPAPTYERFTPADLEETTVQLPKSEWLLEEAWARHGVCGALRETGLYLSEPAIEGASAWPDVEVKHLWGDQSSWEMPWGAKLFSEELEEAKKTGKPLRNNTLVRLQGGNHFAHWDLPEKTLAAFLSDDAEIV